MTLCFHIMFSAIPENFCEGLRWISVFAQLSFSLSNSLLGTFLYQGQAVIVPNYFCFFFSVGNRIDHLETGGTQSTDDV